MKLKERPQEPTEKIVYEKLKKNIYSYYEYVKKRRP